jgi:hypothetical protein
MTRAIGGAWSGRDNRTVDFVAQTLCFIDQRLQLAGEVSQSNGCPSATTAHTSLQDNRPNSVLYLNLWTSPGSIDQLELE